MAADGYEGAYGFYEAIDYTASRQPPGASHTIVRQFMAHHEGMSLLSLGYLLLDRPMQRRFEAEPMLRAAISCCKSVSPRPAPPYSPRRGGRRHPESRPSRRGDDARLHRPGRRDTGSHAALKRPVHTVVTSAGGGYSRWRDFR